MEQFEKVVKGLECHSENRICAEECPYYSPVICSGPLCRDALALIRQQQERIKELEAAQTARVMPLDKLCEWLGKFGCPCDIDDFMCDMALGAERCLGAFESNAFCWRYSLTKLMEGLDAPD